MVARELLGRVVVVRRGPSLLAAAIVETEAYLGRDDPASHAFRGPTPRAAIMYGPPGRLYVYFTYGAHHCMNVVAREDAPAGAVLIRALEPLLGVDEMRARRGVAALLDVASGPGKACAALGVDRADNGRDLRRGPIVIREGREVAGTAVLVGRRVGIRVATDRPYRFAIAGNPHVSRPWT